MMWVYIVSYLIVGFTFLLIGQILNHKGYHEFDIFEAENDIHVFRIIKTAIVLCWPTFAIWYILVLFIPWLVMLVYKLFVGIIFGTIALFKHGKEEGDK